MTDATRTLLGHLAQWGALSVQGEVLSTQGLCFLLEDDQLNEVVTRLITTRSGIELPSGLVWHAESCQDDRSRPDLEGLEGSLPIVKVEAKIWAFLTSDQLLSYSNDQWSRLGASPRSGVLVVLVPENRRTEATAEIRSAFQLEGDDPWAVHDRQRITILSWEEVLDACATVANADAAADIRQLRGMVACLVGPSSGSQELGEAWEGQRANLLDLVDAVTRRLTRSTRVYPMGTEWTGYRRRYVVPDPESETIYSIGICAPPDEHTDTAIWLRFHVDTPGFNEVRSRVAKAGKLVLVDRHAWFGLVPPAGASQDEKVESLVEQARAIEDIAYGR